MKRRSAGLKLGVLLVCAGAVSPSMAQITTNTALPVGKGQGIVRLQSRVVRSKDDAGPVNRELRVVAFPLVGAYGATSRLALFGVLPFASKDMTVSSPQGRLQRDDSGLLDVRLFARYTAWQRNRRGETMRLAPFAGFELPTGTDDKMDDQGKFPGPLQLGSGSLDAFAGLVYSWQTFDWQIDASAAYAVNSEANDFQFGDEIRLDLATKARILPRHLGGGMPSFLYVNLETNLIWQDENEVDSVTDPNSGGTTWYLAPGIQYATTRIILETALQIPAVQDLNGMALENDYIYTIGLRINF